MEQALHALQKLNHLQRSTVEPFTWRGWGYQFCETGTAKDSAQAEKEARDDFFRRHRAEAVKFWGVFCEMYDVREAYERGLRRNDPLLAPHGLFRSLAYKNNAHAREFLEKFGPLWLPPGATIVSPESRVRREGSGDVHFMQHEMEIDLAQFWGLHRRFCLVAQLWEAKGNRAALVNAWRELERHREEASQFDYLPLGATDRTHLDPPDTYYDAWWPWEHPKQGFENWLRETSTSVLRSEALKIVSNELNLHIRGARIYWERGWEPSGAKFRQVVAADDLWSVMWEFFGWDTAGQSWRRCPHCERLFYPKRRDQFYCTSRQQALASKREYARRRRAKEERDRRKRKRGAIR